MKTYRIDRLYHKFLKGQGQSIELLSELTAQLEAAGFIETRPPDDSSGLLRYAETEKLTSRKHRDELFDLVRGLKHAKR